MFVLPVVIIMTIKSACFKRRSQMNHPASCVFFLFSFLSLFICFFRRFAGIFMCINSFWDKQLHKFDKKHTWKRCDKISEIVFSFNFWSPRSETDIILGMPLCGQSIVALITTILLWQKSRVFLQNAHMATLECPPNWEAFAVFFKFAFYCICCTYEVIKMMLMIINNWFEMIFFN